MREEHLLEFIQFGGFHVRIGSRYRPLCDRRDADGQLIDLGYNLYRREHGRWRLSYPGPNGDKPAPDGVTMPQPGGPDRIIQGVVDVTDVAVNTTVVTASVWWFCFRVVGILTMIFGVLMLVGGLLGLRGCGPV